MAHPEAPPLALTTGTVALAAQEALHMAESTGACLPTYVTIALSAASELRDAPPSWTP
jgi:hypothetical protein